MTKIHTPIHDLNAELEAMIARQEAADTPSPAEIARARAVIVGAEYDAQNMGVCQDRGDKRTPEARDEDREFLRALEGDTTTALGALARQLDASHVVAIDASDNLARLSFLVSFIVRRCGLDLDALVAEYNDAAQLVAAHGEGEGYVPPGRAS